MKAHIVNVDEVDPQPLPSETAPTGDAATRYAPRIARIGRMLGAQQLGYSLIVLAPGMRAFPFHHHRVNEEMFFIVEGKGEVRLGDETHAVRAGDVIACPAGEHDTAHQLINTSAGDLRYLAISTQLSPDIVTYPETGRHLVTAAEEPARMPSLRGFRALFRPDDSEDYWHGE